MLQRKLAEIQNKWWNGPVEDPHIAGKYGLFYQAMRAVYGPSYQTLSPLRSSEVKKRLTDKASIVGR